MYWGYHFIVDMADCDHTAITSRENIDNFVKALVHGIAMKAYGEPIIEHFATHDPDKAGHSLVQLIETSNISAHFVDKDNSGFIDIFSCKPFDTKVAKDIIQHYFAPKRTTDHLILRKAPTPQDGSNYKGV